MPKLRQHNQYFRTVTARTCNCGAQYKEGGHVWSWGEYVRAKWYTVKWFCEKCFHYEVKDLLTGHTDTCGCKVNLVGYQGQQLPEWLTLECHVAQNGEGK